MSIKSRNGLNDSDKVFVTVALWISAITVFAVALTLPMLPNEVSIFYRVAESKAKPYSKYNNLALMLTAIIPMFIICIATALRRRNKIRHNFPSVLLFCIMLSLCMGGVIIYGIVKQFEASGTVTRVNNHALVALLASFLFSIMSAVAPSVINSDTFAAKADKRSQFAARFYILAEKYWFVGSYGFLVCGMASSFAPYIYSYIALAASVVAYIVFYLVCYKKCASHEAKEERKE